MRSSMNWLGVVIRIAIAPVLLGAIAVFMHPRPTANDVAAAIGLLLLAAIHVVYWWDPWPRRARVASVAVASMVTINFVLLNLFGVSEPLVWLYPALIAGAGLRAPWAVVAIGFTALAAAAPLALEASLFHPYDPVHATEALGPSHSVLLSIVLAGLGTSAVRQLIAANAELHATRGELAEIAVASDRERLARELHDLLARTLSLIAVKAELASRLSARGDAAAAAELEEVQQLARQAVRDVRDTVNGALSPSLESELAAARVALGAAGIDVRIERDGAGIDPSYETTLAWAVREAVTNVVRHSGARQCRITLQTNEGATTLTIGDDGQGSTDGRLGTGLNGLADRVHALGGDLLLEQAGAMGFRLTVCLGATVRQPSMAGATAR